MELRKRYKKVRNKHNEVCSEKVIGIEFGKVIENVEASCRNLHGS
jgi:hypothetical protein